MANKSVFLDRDGVINRYPGDHNYVNNWKEFHFIPGSIQAIKMLNASGFKLFVISNQAGVAKGLYSLEDLDYINKKMNAAFKKHGAHVNGIYYCTHHPDGGCSCRKPKPGLLIEAITKANIEPKTSFFVGDSFIDMKTGSDFGAKTVLVLSGREKISNRSNWKFEPDYIFDNLLITAHYLSSRY